MKAISLPMSQVQTNMSQGSYRPYFFDLAEFDLARVDFESVFFNEADAEIEILKQDYSFCYLRERKLRTVDAFANTNKKLIFNEFLSRLGINIRSTNLFKTGKYLSRIFRPIKHGAFLSGLDIFINSDAAYSGKMSDGISLISLELAVRLGWQKAEAGMSAQFTLFFQGGLVKGHCVVSDRIEHNVIVYNGNIKTEVSFNKNDYAYVALEPVKLSNKLRMDIQTLLNLWSGFGDRQYFDWARKGIERFKSDLMAGKLNDWLDDFKDISPKDYDLEKWVLHKAIWHGIDYRKYPALFRGAWRMFKNSMLKFGEENNGQPVFRIYVPGGKRGYLRVDLRNHDKNGNFTSIVKENEVCLDQNGNLWVHPDKIETLCDIHGGADQDDGFAVVPLEEGKAILYRNPNQYGEVSMMNIVYEGFFSEVDNKINLPLPEKAANIRPRAEKNPEVKNKLIKEYVSKREKVNEPVLEYSVANLLRTYTRITGNQANIGVAANAEMVKTAVKITDEENFRLMQECFAYSLEDIIDSTVKTGVDCSEDMAAVREVFNYAAKEKLNLPQALLPRIPESIRERIIPATNHPLDDLLEAIKFVVDEADAEVIGRGAVSKGNRNKGLIDILEIPIAEIGKANINNPTIDMALSLSKDYRREIAIILTCAEKLSEHERDQFIREEIEASQKKFLQTLSGYTNIERQLIIKSMAYDIYKSESSVHDSVLWIADMEDLRGTASDMIDMLADIEQAAHMKRNGTIERYHQAKDYTATIKSIRLWSKKKLNAEDFAGTNEVLIDNHSALVNDTLLNLGDECLVADGIYSVKHVAQSVSRKKNSRLQNSLTFILA